MFVLKSKYEELNTRHLSTLRELGKAQTRIRAIELELIGIRIKWAGLVNRINAKGGEAFLEKAQIGGSQQFSQDDIKKLIMLCHPDKHGNSPTATALTAQLIKLRK